MEKNTQVTEEQRVRNGICRQFVNGSCSFGQHCFYRHEYPAASSAQVCRYFQKGGCWFGENCRYLHIAGPHRGLLLLGVVRCQ
ncbi:hypothetical protein HF521_007051 [Silurus meridionalis]|uniref:RING-type E3 ubiquitin transferase n=1 Tax=Silurus meridionalis TaxID=175797 RepID=A0A8T0ASJ3_SILME|nr:hypothetical protein HF521_007051 [Silurus meridionalis]